VHLRSVQTYKDAGLESNGLEPLAMRTDPSTLDVDLESVPLLVVTSVGGFRSFLSLVQLATSKSYTFCTKQQLALGGTYQVVINPVFEEHLRDLSNWTLKDTVGDVFPHIHSLSKS